MAQAYGLAPELQRCCWYGIVAFSAFSVIGYVTATRFQGRPPLQAAVASAIMLVATGGLLAALRWRLVIDQHGITRRILGLAQHWPWTDFAAGKIEKRYPHILWHRRRSWWARRWTLGWLSNDDRRSVYAAMNVHYRIPSSPRAPSSLQTKIGMRCRVRIDHAGLHVTTGTQNRAYRWSQVGVSVTRTDELRSDFARLLIVLPDQQVDYKMASTQAGPVPTWRGATAEQLNDVLHRYVPSDRWSESVTGQDCEDIEICRVKLNEVRRNRREFRIVAVLMFLVLTVLGVVSAVKSEWRTMASMLPCSGLILLLIVVTFRQLRQQQRHWTQQLAKHSAANVRAAEHRNTARR